MRNYLWILGVAIILLVLGIFFLNLRPKVDWARSFEPESEEPFGLAYVFPFIAPYFEGDTIYVINELNPDWLDTERGKPVSLVIMADTIKYGLEVAGKLKEFVGKGNQVLLAGSYFEDHDFDEITSRYYWANSFNPVTDEMEYTLYLKRSESGRYYRVYDAVGGRYFEGDILLNPETEILGRVEGMPNFVSVPRGKGRILYHSMPAALTNFVVVKSSIREYVINVFRELEGAEVYWYRPKGMKQPEPEFNSPLRAVLNNDALRTAWWMLGITLVLLVWLGGKRVIPAIPVIESPKNQSLEFARAMGELYFQTGDHADLARKMRIHFMDEMRQRLYLSPQTAGEDWVKEVSVKTGVNLEDVKKIYTELEQAGSGKITTAEALMAFSKKINAFKEKAHLN